MPRVPRRYANAIEAALLQAEAGDIQGLRELPPPPSRHESSVGSDSGQATSWSSGGSTLELVRSEELDSAGESREPVGREDLSEDQASVFEAICDWARRPAKPLLSVGGYAGTGKSTVLSLVAKALSDDKRIAFCAFTGRAAALLGRMLREAGVDMSRHSCTTIHGLIYKAITDPKTGEVLGFRRLTSLDPYDMVVIDEASMVSEDLIDDVRDFGKPILAVGDHGQLPPVGRDRSSLVERPDLRLEQIHRQAAGHPIIRLSAAVRAGEDPLEYADLGTAIRRVDASVGRTDLLQTLYQRGAGAGHDTALLCYLNSTRCDLNDRVRQHLGFEDLLVPGDWVICLKNKRFGPMLVANGMRGQVETAAFEGEHWHRAVVAHPDEGFRLDARLVTSQLGEPYTFSQYDDFEFRVYSWTEVDMLYDYGYALTVHKAQGCEFRRVAVFIERPEKATNDEEYQRWLYTAVTRASEELWLIANH